MDPFEVSPDSAMYMRWMADQMWTFVPAQQIVGEFLQTFKKYPQRMPIASLNIDEILRRLQTSPHN